MRREEITQQERNELQSLLLGIALGGISAILSCDKQLWFTKLLELQQNLSQGVEILYYGRPDYFNPEPPAE
ncbi:hypothetical protein UFOVP685_30 [uncultured Caudovirales phage]|uniref:Uncharacterized protein n=1 Tax=uncultured Caudovirales phage TaxID=2100421 RepID=A0A6J5NIF0_9CAUD|nr:hypothetical protein UFOVP590_54 [uncultured Caudovirales phage]CAB4157516.1 hypothetical protein UFOVP685_30 [uncultured Caudovirales phage]CAB5225392.1 hypothetical protein UFOVP750_22 [uncultured Caudovirales phage]